MKVLTGTGHFLTSDQSDYKTMLSWTIYSHRTPAEKMQFMSDQFIEIDHNPKYGFAKYTYR